MRREKSSDELWMQRAVDLGYRGFGTTSPNPPVGAVIVRDGQVLGEGYHRKAGEPHAERCALADARAKGNGHLLRGATIYVTLEPCSSYGRTPPCTEGIIEAGISRVVYGAVDPDQRHRGRADAILKAAGVQVLSGVEKEACEALLRPWKHAVTRGRPWVLAKVACTLDGSMSRRETRRISCEEALRHAHELRLRSDAILVGGQTVRTDNPALTIRCPLSPVPDVKQQPWRVVVTRHRDDLPAGAALWADAYAERTLVYEDIENWRSMLEELYRERGVVTLMLECGGNLLRQFLAEGLVDEWVQDIAPILSGSGQPILGADYLPSEVCLQVEQCYACGVDQVIRGTLHYH